MHNCAQHAFMDDVKGWEMDRGAMDVTLDVTLLNHH